MTRWGGCGGVQWGSSSQFHNCMNFKYNVAWSLFCAHSGDRSYRSNIRAAGWADRGEPLHLRSHMQARWRECVRAHNSCVWLPFLSLGQARLNPFNERAVNGLFVVGVIHVFRFWCVNRRSKNILECSDGIWFQTGFARGKKCPYIISARTRG